MTNLLDSLKGIKDKLNEMESGFSHNKPEENIPKVNNKEILEKSLKDFKTHNTKKISINVGGKLYSFSEKAINNCKLQNIFNTGERKIFYDGSPELFSYIAQIFRFFRDREPNSDSKLTIVTDINADDIIIKEMIRQIFIKPDEEVYKHVSIEKQKIKVKVQPTAPQNNNNNDNRNANYDYYGGGGRNAAYNYNYDY